MFNPANGEEIGEMCDLTAADTKHAVDAACDAFPTWSKTSAKVSINVIVIELAVKRTPIFLYS